MLEYCFSVASEQADQPLHVWSRLLRKEVQARRRSVWPAVAARARLSLRLRAAAPGLLLRARTLGALALLPSPPPGSLASSTCTPTPPLCPLSLPQGGVGIRLAARALLATAHAYAALPPLAKRATSWPFRKLSGAWGAAERAGVPPAVHAAAAH